MCPKRNAPIYDKPTLHYIVKEARDSGCTDISIIISEGKDAIKKYFSTEGPYSAIRDRSRLAEIDELISKANISYITQKLLMKMSFRQVQLAKTFTETTHSLLLHDDVIKTSGDPAARQSY